MCRSIKKLRGEPQLTKADIDAAALQFVRKVSGFQKPSKANQPVFEDAVRNVSETTENLLKALGVKPDALALPQNSAAPPRTSE